MIANALSHFYRADEREYKKQIAEYDLPDFRKMGYSAYEYLLLIVYLFNKSGFSEGFGFILNINNRTMYKIIKDVESDTRYITLVKLINMSLVGFEPRKIC